MTPIETILTETEKMRREIERLTAELVDLPQAQADTLAECRRLGQERDDLRERSDHYKSERDAAVLICESDQLKMDFATIMGSLHRCEKERDTLRTFAKHIMEYWPCGDVDECDLQCTAIELGLLKLTEPAPREPCGEGCECAQNCSADEFESGEVQCYRKTALLMGEKV